MKLKNIKPNQVVVVDAYDSTYQVRVHDVNIERGFVRGQFRCIRNEKRRYNGDWSGDKRYKGQGIGLFYCTEVRRSKLK